MAHYHPQWDDDLSQPVFNPYSPLNPAPSAAAVPPPPPARPISSTMPEVYHPPSTEKEVVLPSFVFPAGIAAAAAASPSPRHSHNSYSYNNHHDSSYTSNSYSNNSSYNHSYNNEYSSHTYEYDYGNSNSNSNHPKVAFHAAPAVNELPSTPINAPGPAFFPSSSVAVPFFVGPGDLLVPARTPTPTTLGDTDYDYDDPRVAAMEKPSSFSPSSQQKQNGWWWRRVPLKWRWAILALAAVVVIAVAAGIAVSLTNNSNSSSSSSDSSTDDGGPSSSDKDPSSSPTTTTTTSPPLSATSFLSSPSTTPGPGSVAIECPDANNTAWWTAVTGPTTSKEGTGTLTTNATLVRLCDRAYAVDDAAAVIRNTTAQSFEECMGECAVWNAAWPASGWRSGEAQNECVGVSWGFEGKQGTGENYCWLMKKVDEPGGDERTDWESALIVVKDVVDDG